MKIHGQWQVSRVRNIIVQTIAGAFNEEGARARAEELRALAPGDGPWAVLGNSTNWDMGNVATLKIVEAMRDWMRRHGCVCIATVVPSGFRRTVHQEHTGEAPVDFLRYCATLDEACDWLSERGFPFTVDDYPHYEFLERSRMG